MTKPVTTAIAVNGKKDEGNLSSSAVPPYIPADVKAANKALTADKLHEAILLSYATVGEASYVLDGLILDARRRLDKGEIVGTCVTWKSYAAAYFIKENESLPTCLRRLRRQLEGLNPDVKHKNRRKKTNRQIVEQSDDDDKDVLATVSYEKGRKKGFKEGEDSMKVLAAKIAADKKVAFAAQKGAVAEKKAAERLNKKNEARHYEDMLLTLLDEIEKGGDLTSLTLLAATFREALNSLPEPPKRGKAKMPTAAEITAASEKALKNEPSQASAKAGVSNGNGAARVRAHETDCALAPNHAGDCRHEIPDGKLLTLDENNVDDGSAIPDLTKGSGQGSSKLIESDRLHHGRAQEGRLAL